ncbi:MAG: SCP2 sterol-binding domain-containing protein [Nitrososphaerota archaeon]|nr:SCP2 sterol-binding domain-containing protein [Nitrososphaerota archaeon]
MAGKCSRAISLLADYMNKTSEVKNFISGWSSAIQFDLSGEDPFGLVFSADGRVDFKTGKLDRPDVTFYCNSDLFFQVITGKVDQDEAFSNGLVDVKGSIFDSVKFRHAAELTQEKHSTLFAALRAFSRFA